MTDLIGTYLGRYHILERLGEGGMAQVYKAFDTRLERYVAVKVILPSRQHSPDFLIRFQREAKALGQLSHPNIVKILDSGELDELPFLVMEYISGGTLKRWLDQPIPWREAAQILSPVARALEYAHQNQMIHRDVKPTNILMTDKGQPMLADFGISKMLHFEETMDLSITGTGVGVGTPEYMSPEQGLGKGVDPRSDVYSLGIVFFEMIAGRTPYKADTPLAVLLKQVSEPLPRPKKFVRDLPARVEQVLIKALAKQPEDRYPDMGAFATALEKLSLGQGSGHVEKKPGQGWPAKPAMLVGSAGTFLVLILALGLYMSGIIPPIFGNGSSSTALTQTSEAAHPEPSLTQTAIHSHTQSSGLPEQTSHAETPTLTPAVSFDRSPTPLMPALPTETFTPTPATTLTLTPPMPSPTNTPLPPTPTKPPPTNIPQPPTATNTPQPQPSPTSTATSSGVVRPPTPTPP